MIRHIVIAAVAVPLTLAAVPGVWAQELPATAAEDLQSFVGDQPPSFATVEELAENFGAAVKAGDKSALAVLLGLSASKVLASKEVEDSFQHIQQAAAESIAVREAAADRRTLLLGDEVWPFPFPIVKVDGRWAFDTVAGLEEVINRRIGENELTTVANMRAYVDAQEEYKQTDWDEDGVSEYAQKLISSPGVYDGLYWQPGDGVPESPVGSLISEAELATAKQDGYFGYRYRPLTKQGENVAGGAYDYVINGNMIGGFGLIATPVKYDRTGIMTFVVNQYGTVYQKDLGADTQALADKMDAFDPDDSWTVVTDPGD
ncbi:Protein of unknown function [Mesorhizobium albiziae]|uniref:DUF2950 domain-containing protein n=1 Tax=Neomesorhizobium albiziae TaxID=335020 RepID=A0A1I3VPC2_9HYPH|nr:DUF2950 domain-containing protein [Mesorhizobium albiziae]GLS29060.1 hypothetical protein GCM10007937_07670 [Mesorhizobium albiziae]SFJ96803.1 Protein of unknown function [Mesorhizobium albiziae]